MFDIGWQELFILAVLAIIVVGPKDLPRAIKTVTHWIRKARSMARDLQDGLDDVVREAELDDIKTEANKMMGEGFGPASRLADEFDMADLEKDWSETVNDLKSVTNPDKEKKLDDKPVREPVDDDMIDEIAGLDESPEPDFLPAPKPKREILTDLNEPLLQHHEPVVSADSGGEPKKSEG